MFRSRGFFRTTPFWRRIASGHHTLYTRVPYGFSRRVQRPHTHAHTRTRIYARAGQTSSDPFTDNNNIPTGPEDSAGGDVNGPAAIRTGRVPTGKGKKKTRAVLRFVRLNYFPCVFFIYGPTPATFLPDDSERRRDFFPDDSDATGHYRRVHVVYPFTWLVSPGRTFCERPVVVMGLGLDSVKHTGKKRGNARSRQRRRRR